MLNLFYLVRTTLPIMPMCSVEGRPQVSYKEAVSGGVRVQ